jgi:hypothetical protein
MPRKTLSQTKQGNYYEAVASRLVQELLPSHQSKGLGKASALQIGVSV